jgi:hypothetical protein
LTSLRRRLTVLGETLQRRPNPARSPAAGARVVGREINAVGQATFFVRGFKQNGVSMIIFKSVLVLYGF